MMTPDTTSTRFNAKDSFFSSPPSTASRSHVPEVTSSACRRDSPCSYISDDVHKGIGFASLRPAECEVAFERSNPFFAKPYLKSMQYGWAEWAALKKRSHPTSSVYDLVEDNWDNFQPRHPPSHANLPGAPIPFNLPSIPSTQSSLASGTNLDSPNYTTEIDFGSPMSICQLSPVKPARPSPSSPMRLPLLMSICLPTPEPAPSTLVCVPASRRQPPPSPPPAPVALHLSTFPQDILPRGPLFTPPRPPQPPASPMHICGSSPCKETFTNPTAALFSPPTSPPGAWLEELREMDMYHGGDYIDRIAKEIGLSREQALAQHGHWIIGLKI